METIKPRLVIIGEAILYFLIGFLAPVVAVLDSDKALNSRVLYAMCAAGLFQGLLSLKAFFSQSFSDWDKGSHSK